MSLKRSKVKRVYNKTEVKKRCVKHVNKKNRNISLDFIHFFSPSYIHDIINISYAQFTVLSVLILCKEQNV